MTTSSNQTEAELAATVARLEGKREEPEMGGKEGKLMDIQTFRLFLQKSMANSGILVLVDPKMLREPIQRDKEIDRFLDEMVSRLYPVFISTSGE